MITAAEIGWKASVALARARGRARVLAVLSDSTYLTAGGEIVWLGGADAPLHPRAILTARRPEPPAIAGGVLPIDARAARRWQPPPFPRGACSSRAMAAGCRALVDRLETVGVPDGLGTLLRSVTPAFPLDRAAPAADALARACAADDAGRAAAAAKRLLGLGPGLTPSGDDYVGGAFFARACRVPAARGGTTSWDRAAAEILAAARDLTHPISAALLGDLLEGHGWAPLHDLARALAADAPLTVAVAAARRVVRLGHSSGWDILAGFVAGTLGER